MGDSVVAAGHFSKIRCVDLPPGGYPPNIPALSCAYACSFHWHFQPFLLPVLLLGFASQLCLSSIAGQKLPSVVEFVMLLVDMYKPQRLRRVQVRDGF
jgi:hypothetical protein